MPRVELLCVLLLCVLLLCVCVYVCMLCVLCVRVRCVRVLCVCVCVLWDRDDLSLQSLRLPIATIHQRLPHGKYPLFTNVYNMTNTYYSPMSTT